MKTDISQKKFLEVYTQKYPDLDKDTVEHLIESNLIDYRTMKIALVRHYVYDCIKHGCGTREAMRIVSEGIATSYQYVKNAFYNKQDVNI